MAASDVPLYCGAKQIWVQLIDVGTPTFTAVTDLTVNIVGQ
jgi:hypothetical protein